MCPLLLLYIEKESKTMKELGDKNIQELLVENQMCLCGKVHQTKIKDVTFLNDFVSKGSSELNCSLDQDSPEELELLAKISPTPWGYQRPFIVSDTHTEKEMGVTLKEFYSHHQIPYGQYVFASEGDLVPDEKAIGEVFIHFDRETDVIIAIGSGTINDLCRYLSYQLKMPYWIVATAPSVDGFASTAAALIINHLKTTLYCHEPERILAVGRVLCNAPLRMIQAGVSDLLGKYTALLDWKIGRVVTGEYYCEAIVNMVESAVDQCVEQIEQIKNREPKAIQSLMEALVLSGIAMSFTGNSRPASGSEHHLSHFFEMKNILQGRINPLHGEKVGMSTLLMMKLYRHLLEIIPDGEVARQQGILFNTAQRNSEILIAFELAGETIIKEQSERLLEKELARIGKIIANWPSIVALILAAEAKFTECERAMETIQAPMLASDLKISDELVVQAIIFAKEIRPRYTVLSLYEDLGLLKEERIKEIIYC